MAKSINYISRITVKGFKSICAEQSIEIRPLTILAGANSSGKSSIMQPLLLLKQTLETPSDPGALLLDGPNVRFTSANQLLSWTSGKSFANEFNIKLDFIDKQSLELIFTREEGKGFEVTQMDYNSDVYKIKISPSMTHEAILKILPQKWISSYEDIKKVYERISWGIHRERCFLSFKLTGTIMTIDKIISGPYLISPANDFIPHIQNLIHLSGFRGNPRRTYPITAGGPHFQGTFEPYVASIISQWQDNPSDKRLSALGNALKEMGLTWRVKAERLDDTQVELKVGRLPRSAKNGGHDLVSIADVGFGVSQVLPVIVALFAAQQGQLVYLEQPEIHLHPLAQRKLAKIICDAIQRGVITIMETHSALLLREIQTLVATNQVSKDDIALHWFERQRDGSTKITTADLDENGAYGNWPEDFDKTELEGEQAYLDAIEKSAILK